MIIELTLGQADILQRVLYAEQNDAKKRIKHAHSHGEITYKETEFFEIAGVLGNISYAIAQNKLG